MGWSLPTFQSHPSQQQVMQKGAKPLAMITEEHSCLQTKQVVNCQWAGGCVFQKSAREYCKLYAKIKSK